MIELIKGAHVSCAILVLVSGTMAVLAKSFMISHKFHMLFGNLFFWCILIVCFTSIPIAISSDNTFLSLLGFFCFLLALSGWSFAKNRTGNPWLLDYLRPFFMLVVTFSMAVYGVLIANTQVENALGVFSFATIGLILTMREMRVIFGSWVSGTTRIVSHLRSMFASLVAAITGFCVANVNFEPVIILWAGPALVFAPFVQYWDNRVRRAGRDLPDNTG